MAIRITVLHEPTYTVLKVDGWLKREDTGELAQMIKDLKGPTALDLTELHSIDREVAEGLRRLIETGVTVRAASPYVDLLLRPSAEPNETTNFLAAQPVRYSPTRDTKPTQGNPMRKATLYPLLIISSFCVRQAWSQDAKASPASVNPASVVAASASNSDLEVIRASCELFVTAFNKGDAKSIASLWATDGEYIDEFGNRFQGREAIEKCYADVFANDPDAKIQVSIDALRMISDIVAIEDGRVTAGSKDRSKQGFTQYTATHVKLDGKWLMASVRDAWIEAPVSMQSAADLGWLVGTWQAEEYGVTTESEIRWVIEDRFLERRYTVTQPDGTKTSGLQLIGWNPLGGHVQSWDFSPDGGHAVSIWIPIDGGWQAESQGTTGQGVPSMAVSVLRSLDKDAYVWQSVRRTLGEVTLPDTEEVVIKRVVKP